MSIGRENIIWGREKCKNGREKKYNVTLLGRQPPSVGGAPRSARAAKRNRLVANPRHVLDWSAIAATLPNPRCPQIQVLSPPPLAL